jgi:hypothetical protein
MNSNSTNSQDRTGGYLALSATSILWGTTWVASKIGVADMPALQIAYIRQFIAGACFVLFFMITQKPNDDCYFLDSKTRLCSVYEKRPDTCRQFPSQLGTRVGFCPVEYK